MLPIADWANFYVIVGSAAAGLTGLTFVVVALVADARMTQLSGVKTFMTPMIVHFCSALGLAALMCVPHLTPVSLGVCLDLVGVGGVIYSVRIITRMHGMRQTYNPVFEDWLWNGFMPKASYWLLLIAGLMMSPHPVAALNMTALAAVMLLFIGIHNAWDLAVWITAERPSAQKANAERDKADVSAPPADEPS